MIVKFRCITESPIPEKHYDLFPDSEFTNKNKFEFFVRSDENDSQIINSVYNIVKNWTEGEIISLQIIKDFDKREINYIYNVNS